MSMRGLLQFIKRAIRMRSISLAWWVRQYEKNE